MFEENGNLGSVVKMPFRKACYIEVLPHEALLWRCKVLLHLLLDLLFNLIFELTEECWCLWLGLGWLIAARCLTLALLLFLDIAAVVICVGIGAVPASVLIIFLKLGMPSNRFLRCIYGFKSYKRIVIRGVQTKSLATNSSDKRLFLLLLFRTGFDIGCASHEVDIMHEVFLS